MQWREVLVLHSLLELISTVIVTDKDWFRCLWDLQCHPTNTWCTMESMHCTDTKKSNCTFPRTKSASKLRYLGFICYHTARFEVHWSYPFCEASEALISWPNIKQADFLRPLKNGTVWDTAVGIIGNSRIWKTPIIRASKGEGFGVRVSNFSYSSQRFALPCSFYIRLKASFLYIRWYTSVSGCLANMIVAANHVINFRLTLERNDQLIEDRAERTFMETAVHW